MPFRATFDCLWCGDAYTSRGPDDLEGWAQLCSSCVGKAGDNAFLRFRLHQALTERGAASGGATGPARGGALATAAVGAIATTDPATADHPPAGSSGSRTSSTSPTRSSRRATTPARG